MPSKEIITPTAEIETIVGLINQGIKCWAEAGRLLVERIDADSDFTVKFLQAHPEVPNALLIAFEKIGRKQIYPALLADTSCGARALLECPYEIQERYTTAPIPVVADFSRNTIVKKRISHLSRSEVKQVFSFGNILTPKQQLSERSGDQRNTASRTPINSAPATPVLSKIERLGCFRLTIKGSTISVEPVTETFRAQQVKINISAGGERTVDILLYR